MAPTNLLPKTIPSVSLQATLQKTPSPLSVHVGVCAHTHYFEGLHLNEHLPSSKVSIGLHIKCNECIQWPSKYNIFTYCSVHGFSRDAHLNVS